MKPSDARILAVDPGYERLGVAVLDGPTGNETLVYSACFQTKPSTPHPERLAQVYQEIIRVITAYSPHTFATETLFFSVNQKTALKVAEARGALLSAAACAGLPVVEFSPQAIKIAVTGEGNSDKKQVTAMTKRLIRVTKPVQHDDEYDAIAIGLTALASPSRR
ncbi:MAG: crossover junction endodeoxyribonuclease RuvC [Candidatus Paceibacterota bacterium]